MKKIILTLIALLGALYSSDSSAGLVRRAAGYQARDTIRKDAGIEGPTPIRPIGARGGLVRAGARQQVREEMVVTGVRPLGATRGVARRSARRTVRRRR